MTNITIHDKQFKKFIDSNVIETKVSDIANLINNDYKNKSPVIFPNESMIGALIDYISVKNQIISNRKKNQFQPMPASFGLMPELTCKIKDKKLRYVAYKERSLRLLQEFKKTLDSYLEKDQLLFKIN